ncbi:MAG: hypothetical protein PHP74_04220 [Candidatus Gracilibacteria bacterium]|nr:hypothetical protein [Candidatus Gracilibacteria bacterium]
MNFAEKGGIIHKVKNKNLNKNTIAFQNIPETLSPDTSETKEKVKGTSAKKLKVLKESIDAEEIKKFNFELGESDVEKGKDREIFPNLKSYSMEGGVDATSYSKLAKRNPEFYKKKSESALNFLMYFDYIDLSEFGNLGKQAKELNNLLFEISAMTDYSDNEWKKFIAKNKYPDSLIYGPEGVLNLLLAFERAIAPVKNSDNLNLKDFKNGSISPIKLYLGKKPKDQPSRFAKFHTRPKPKKQPEVKDEPAPGSTFPKPGKKPISTPGDK